jgi:carbamoyltransferase
MKYIVGISAFYHDSAAVLLKDGKIIAAFQEERFTRIKQDKSFPVNAIGNCLKIAGITLKDVDFICYYENPHKKFLRILSTYFHNVPRGFLSFTTEMKEFLKGRKVEKKILKNLEKNFGFQLKHKQLFFSEHHLSHAASAFYPSPFESAAVLCLDGVGEFATTSVWEGNGRELKFCWQINFPHSLGLLYSAFTYFCGFKVDSGEYKLMGLAPYGRPKYKDIILSKLVHIYDDGTFILNRTYFNYEVGDEMTAKKFAELFGGSRREPETKITDREINIAASIQAVTEEIILKLAKTIRRETGQEYLCLAGGVALNCVANGKLLRSDIFKDIWIQPASGDAGGALGAALLCHFSDKKNKRIVAKEDQMQGSYLGNEYKNEEIKKVLDSFGAVYSFLEEKNLETMVADKIKKGNVVGWFQGKMEFGPRALGARSILGDPQNKTMQSVINLKIKNRESFRPFAPAIINEYTTEWFELDRSSQVEQISTTLKSPSEFLLNFR